MLYSCTHMATVGVKGCENSSFLCFIRQLVGCVCGVLALYVSVIWRLDYCNTVATVVVVTDTIGRVQCFPVAVVHASVTHHLTTSCYLAALTRPVSLDQWRSVVVSCPTMPVTSCSCWLSGRAAGLEVAQHSCSPRPVTPPVIAALVRLGSSKFTWLNECWLSLSLVAGVENHWLMLILTLWRPLLPHGYSYKASCARPSERQSARMSKITNDGLTRSDTGCFIAVPI